MADSLALAVAGVPADPGVDVSAHVPGFLDSQLSDGEATVELAEQSSSKMSGCLLDCRGPAEASAVLLCPCGQAVVKVAYSAYW